MSREEILALIAAWDPEHDDLPDAVAEALDDDPVVAAAFDAKFEPLPLPEEPMPDGLVERLLEPTPEPVAPANGSMGWVAAAAAAAIAVMAWWSPASAPLETTAPRTAATAPLPSTPRLAAADGALVQLRLALEVPGVPDDLGFARELLMRGQRPPAGLVRPAGMLASVPWDLEDAVQVEVAQSPADPSVAVAAFSFSADSAELPDAGRLSIGMDLSGSVDMDWVAEELVDLSDDLEPGDAIGVMGATGELPLYGRPGPARFASRLRALTTARRPGVRRAAEFARETAVRIDGRLVLLTDAADEFPETWALAVPLLQSYQQQGIPSTIIWVGEEPAKARLVREAAVLGGAGFEAVPVGGDLAGALRRASRRPGLAARDVTVRAVVDGRVYEDPEQRPALLAGQAHTSVFHLPMSDGALPEVRFEATGLDPDGDTVRWETSWRGEPTRLTLASSGLALAAGLDRLGAELADPSAVATGELLAYGAALADHPSATTELQALATWVFTVAN